MTILIRFNKKKSEEASSRYARFIFDHIVTFQQVVIKQKRILNGKSPSLAASGLLWSGKKVCLLAWAFSLTIHAHADNPAHVQEIRLFVCKNMCSLFAADNVVTADPPRSLEFTFQISYLLAENEITAQ